MPLVAGLRAFRDALAGFEDCYALIGGGTMCRDAERFLGDAESFAARTTNRKERDRRTNTVEFLRRIYLT